MSITPTNAEELRAEVSTRYARTARQVLLTGQQAVDPCCGPTCCTPTATAATPAESRKILPTVEAEQTAGCCSTDSRDASVITSDLYTQAELGAIPVAAALASLGCGNPTALAELTPGERVLDLGSGGGIDVLLSARRVGPTGFAYGLDMTDTMLELAERNRAGALEEDTYGGGWPVRQRFHPRSQAVGERGASARRLIARSHMRRISALPGAIRNQ